MSLTSTLQERGKTADSVVDLPYAYAHQPWYRVTIEYKSAGQVVRSDTFINVAEKTADGEVLQRWERVT